MNNFIIRTITGILFVAIMVTGICLRGDAMILLFAIITGLSLWEFCGLVNEHVADTTVNSFIATAAGVYLFLAMAGYCTGIVPPSAFVPYLLTIIYLFISELYLKQKNPIQDWAYTMLSQMYVALPFSMINVLSFQADPQTGQIAYHWMLPMSVFVFLWVNDTGAYCTGSLLGRHKLFPRVSPGKSWEGSIGGGIFVLIAAAIISQFAATGTPLGSASQELSTLNAQLSTLKWLGLGLVVVFFGTWGDLVESLFKRTLGIKDSGNILPGHGGMMDRFDSVIFTAPIVYLLASLLMELNV